VTATDTPSRTNHERLRLARWAAWSLWALTMLVVALAGVIVAASPAAARYAQESELGYLIFAVLFSTIGLVVAWHRLDNPIGWLFGLIGLLGAVALAGNGYAGLAVLDHVGALPGGTWAALLATWADRTITALLVLLFLLFPDGQLPSRRWQRLLRPVVAVLLLLGLVDLLRPDAIQDALPGVPNPVGIEPTGLLLEAGLAAFGALTLVSFAAAVVVVLTRLRRARGAERQQLKWFVYAGSLIAASFILAPVLPLPEPWPYLPLALALLFLPVAIGIAVLRYRLYDIDRLINRTLVYGLLTVLLGCGYAAAVLMLGQLFGGVTRDPPNWVVAGATLAVAALFQPARRRIQQGVDRRFNRRKFDAAKTVEAFSVRLRDEVDLDALTADLLVVVDQTMQPTTASLWLRPSARARRTAH
jgi:MFS/sugar transport protein